MLRFTPKEQQLWSDCGAAAAYAVARFFGIYIKSYQEFLDEVGTTWEGTGPAQIIRVLRRRNLRVKSKHGMTFGDVRDAIKRKHPVICVIYDHDYKCGHWTVVIGIGKKFVTIADPYKGIKRLRLDKFESIWYDGQYIKYGIEVSRE